MPRLEDGELVTLATKFKKRRAWIASDEADVPLPVKKEESAVIDTHPEPLIETRVKHDYNKSITRLTHERNKSETRVEHDYNKSVTRIEQSKPRIGAAISSDVSRLEQECNKSVTRLEHDYNKDRTALDLNSFHVFLALQRADLAYHEDDVRCLILSLSDVQRRMFWHVAFECISRGELRTGPIEIKGFFAPLGITTAVVRTSLNRLTDKRVLQREKGKLGKNGFAIISMPKAILNAVKEIVINFQNTSAAIT